MDNLTNINPHTITILISIGVFILLLIIIFLLYKSYYSTNTPLNYTSKDSQKIITNNRYTEKTKPDDIFSESSHMISSFSIVVVSTI